MVVGHPYIGLHFKIERLQENILPFIFDFVYKNLTLPEKTCLLFWRFKDKIVFDEP